MSFYNTIEQESFAEFKDRGSKFLAFAYPFKDVAQLKPILQSLKKEHAKAVHFCFAYRIGNDGNVFRSTDDGEPSGTAGKPILGQIDSKEITNVLIVVVRYFGGSLLGVPGLINAYKTAAALSLQVVPIVQKPVEKLFRLQFDYTQQNAIMQIIHKYGCNVQSIDNQLFSTMELAIPISRQQEVTYAIKDLPNVECEQIL
jgi:uncharacterized YigZ family protein